MVKIGWWRLSTNALTAARSEATRQTISGFLTPPMMGRFPPPLNEDGQKNVMKKPTGTASAKHPTTNWPRLRSLSDKDIRSALARDPDVRPTDVTFWKNAKAVLPRPKQTVTI